MVSVDNFPLLPVQHGDAKVGKDCKMVGEGSEDVVFGADQKATVMLPTTAAVMFKEHKEDKHADGLAGCSGPLN
jgi:hypothetical protein